MLHVTRDWVSTVFVCEYELVLQVKIFCLVFGVMEEQGMAIKFCVKAGKSAVETIELINKVYGSAARVQSGCGKTLRKQRNRNFKNRE